MKDNTTPPCACQAPPVPCPCGGKAVFYRPRNNRRKEQLRCHNCGRDTAIIPVDPNGQHREDLRREWNDIVRTGREG